VKTPHTFLYAETCCLGAAYAVAVTTVVCLYAIVRLSCPALVCWRDDPALSSPDTDDQLTTPLVAASAGQTNVPMREPTPEEREHASRVQIAKQTREYANTLKRAQKEALQDLISAVCIQAVAWPFFLLHWRLLFGAPAKRNG
jgi:hypothetical protein